MQQQEAGSKKATKAAKERSFQGVPVAEGICHGKILVHWPEDEQIPVYKITQADLPQEIAKFEAALVATRVELLDIQQKIAHAIGSRDASIFDAHLLVVEDRTLIDEVLKKLESDLKNIEYVFDQVTGRYCKTLQTIDDPYLRERVVDIEDVRKRVLRHLLGKHPYQLSNLLDEPHIIIAHNLSPADTALLNKKFILGFATEAGSKTSHTAIMARSLDIPSIVGLTDISEEVRTGDRILLDGYTGLLILNPTEETLLRYGKIREQKEAVVERLELIRDTVSTTRDGRHIILSANIGLPQELEEVRKNGAEGIGLYRTEFLFLSQHNPPTEEEQFENYRLVARRAKPHSVIIRTLDAGGDKFIKNHNLEGEDNPFLGCRAIRFCLQHPDFFKTQLRAILRSAVEGNVRLMYPMISGINELRKANLLLEETKAELKKEGIPFYEDLEVGAMIEIPSAALTAHILAKEVDFFSIGTNDLIQYTVAVDRINEHIAHLYEPTHPAVIRLIKMIIEAAHTEGIWVGICGEMAGDVHLTPLLLGLGIDELSVGTSLVPRVKKAVQSLDMEACNELASHVTYALSGAEILEKCLAVAQKHYSDLLC